MEKSRSYSGSCSIFITRSKCKFSFHFRYSSEAHSRINMERLVGWFWKGSSKTDDQKEIQVENTVKPENNKELKGDSAAADSASDKNNSAQNVVSESIKPILYNKSDQSMIASLSLWLQKHTYLQPEDCLTCKLTITACGTLLLLSGLNAYRIFFQKRKKLLSPKSNVRRLRISTIAGYGSVFAMWGVFMYAEWFNALFYPPGERPRSFIDREMKRLKTLRETLQQVEKPKNKKGTE